MSDARFGDDLAGFTVGFDPAAGAIRVRAWGFWDADLGRAFCGAVLIACRSHAGTQRVLMDMNDLKPMRDEGQGAFVQLVRALPGMGVTQLRVWTSSQLTKLQLLRLAGGQTKGFVEVMSENSQD